ncbi:uncharacterized protein ARMOST_02375 [Armillaria ostoyae]|uniref:Uncharacterized protein n=1 Tax=Armillaria ostoyae TaxID=47428 RepID=A0A284QRI1_ARMOS|nr:uncharacterized protein ARMOST_02375 [Armillaria ostoyae]
MDEALEQEKAKRDALIVALRRQYVACPEKSQRDLEERLAENNELLEKLKDTGPPKSFLAIHSFDLYFSFSYLLDSASYVIILYLIPYTTLRALSSTTDDRSMWYIVVFAPLPEMLLTA